MRCSLRRDLRALYLTRTQATGADINGLNAATNDRLYAANVGLPGSVGLAVGVGNIMTEGHTLAAEFTLCHETTPPIWSFFAIYRLKTDGIIN